MCIQDSTLFKPNANGNICCIDCGSALWNPFHYCNTCKLHKRLEVDAIKHSGKND